MKSHIILFCFISLISSINSCANQSHSTSDTPKKIISKNTTTIDNKIDSTLRLKYTTGIRSILEDSNGNFWFGSHQEGVCLFDGKELTYFTTTDGLSDNQIRSIFEDSNGMIWFEGGRGLSIYNGISIITQTEKNYDSKNNWQAEKNDLWFKGDESIGYNNSEEDFGVYRYDGIKLDFHAFPPEVKEFEGQTYSVSTPFCNGKNGVVWFGTYGAVIGYDPSYLPKGKPNFTIINNKSIGLNKETGYLHVRSILEDSKGNLWIGNNGIGVLLHDGKTTFNFSEAQGLISEKSLRSGGYRSPPNSLEHVFSIGEDRDGNIWFGDRDTGAWKYDGKSMKNYTSEDGLTTTHIWQIYNTKKGELWFAMGNGDVLKFNGESFEKIF